MDLPINRKRAISLLIVLGTILVTIATWDMREKDSN
jgi:hypothetical protein